VKCEHFRHLIFTLEPKGGVIYSVFSQPNTSQHLEPISRTASAASSIVLSLTIGQANSWVGSQAKDSAIILVKVSVLVMVVIFLFLSIIFNGCAPRTYQLVSRDEFIFYFILFTKDLDRTGFPHIQISF